MSALDFCASLRNAYIEQNPPLSPITPILCDELIRVAKEVDDLSLRLKKAETKPPVTKTPCFCDCTAVLNAIEREMRSPPVSDR